jgi:peroxiredoxin
LTLKKKLEQHQGKWNASLRAAYDDLVKRLGRAETKARALKIGDKAPDFALPNAEGKLVVSDELLARGPLVINFFRGDWSPFCRLMLEALNAALPAISAAGGQLIAISPDTGGRLLGAKKRLKVSIELLSDVDNGVALDFGVAFQIPEAYRKELLTRGVNLVQRHGNDAWIIPIPATFVIDKSGIIRYTFVEPEFVRRAEPQEIVEVLQQLSR